MGNSYLNDRKAIDRLKKEYREHKNLIIGFDFDSTIYDTHNEDLDTQPVIDLLKRCSDLGFTMCLHTLCLGDEGYMNHDQKCDYCVELDILVDHVNCSPILNEQSDNYPMKPFYSILLDDRSGLSASYNILLTTLKELELMIEKTTVYGSIRNGGDGSSYVDWFLKLKEAEEDQENMEEGWGEECIETAQTYTGSDIHKEAVENSNDLNL